MKFNFLHIIVFVAIILFGFSFSSKKFSDPNKEKLLIEVVKYVVEKGHYSSLDIDDKISEKIYNTYIEQLDAQKRFFYNQISDNLKNISSGLMTKSRIKI